MDSALAQTLLALSIVIGAGLYLARVAWRQVAAARRARSGCGTDCGCGH
jgi:hypothetical protein